MPVKPFWARFERSGYSGEPDFCAGTRCYWLCLCRPGRPDCHVVPACRARARDSDGSGVPGLVLPPLLGETQKQPNGDTTLRPPMRQRGVLSCALYLSALKDVDKGNPNAYHTSRHCTDGGYQNRPLEPAPHVAGRQEKVRATCWPWRGETSHLYTEHT